jgi:hypothetical protein
MSLYKNFATDPKIEHDGIILNYGPNSKGDDTEIRVARAGGSNTKFAKVLEAKFRPHKRSLANETIDRKLADKLMIEAYSESVILGWKNVEDKDNNPMEFTVANVVKLFTDLPELFKDVQEQSQKSALFRAEIREEEAKNLPRS